MAGVRVRDDEDPFDNDPLLNEEAFLSAVAEVEAQHLGRLTNVLSHDGARFNGGCYGGGGVDDSAGVKRSSQWEAQNINERFGQQLRGTNDSSGPYSVDDGRKRVRLEDDVRTGWNINSYAGPGMEARLGAPRQAVTQPEGEYMAALRGSNSELWQTSGGGRGAILGFPNTAGPSSNSVSGGGFRAGGGSGVCYKCGLEGHWSKDCTAGKSATAHEVPDVPERLCACGAGACAVKTANTEKNQGRNFYRCPLGKNEGQCSFFEWCDAGGQSNPSEKANWQSFSQHPQLECKCGGGPCATLTAKTEKNMGRQFYKCPLTQGGCSFFQWCDEGGANGGGNSSSRVSSYTGNAVSSSPGGGNCYKCGQGGHWSRDCPNQQQQQPYAGSFGGQAQTYNARGTPEAKTTGNCYKCGGQGHWSNACPNSGASGQTFAKQVGGSSGLGGSCYKCGDPGHWANKCPMASGGQR